ncbi:NAD-dependent epimerase/dehydratase family protein [Candidatus Bathyarchaeota archaeon]|nr:NAD-dependent epimerase/dehydratase family protein [Candidatus Bathyarchaeota archaeon]
MINMLDSILIIGSAGSVGHDMVYQIASMGLPIKVIGADVDEEKGKHEIEEALHTAHNFGFYPNLSFEKIDLFDIDGTSEFLKEHNPKVICNLASLGSWWITRLLPPEDYKKVGPVGPWLPNHLTLAHKLMLAVKKSGIDTNVVNGAFPDATNVVLSKLGLEPTCGGGNMDLGLGRVKRVIAREMNVPFRSVQLYGVGHHGAYYTARMSGPYYVKVIVDGKDVSDQWPNEKITKLYQEAGYGEVTQYKSALVDQMRTASSFLKHVLAIYHDTGEVHTCVTGVEGLPGGYPARLSRKGAEIVLPDISREEAIRINEEGGKIDGIEKIKDDGTVVFCEENVEYMREVVGYECTELKPSESEERARELNSLLKKLYDKYNVET